MELFPRLAQKIKKKFLYFLIFLEIKLYSPNIQKVLTFSQRKAFLVFRKRENPQNSLYFRKRRFLIFWKMETPKKLFIFQKVTFWARKLKKFTRKSSWYFSKWNFLIFKGVTCKVWKPITLYTFYQKVTKFLKLKYFFITIIKCFISFYNTFFLYSTRFSFSFSEKFV